MPEPRRTETLRIRLLDPEQLYDAMDPAPFQQRDLDPKANAFITDWARELPAAVAPALKIELASTGLDEPTRVALGGSIGAYFAQRALAARRELRQLFRTGRISLLIGLGFLALATLAGEYLAGLVPHQSYASLLRESFVIGGWVALWRPMEIFLYNWWPILANARRFERLAAMPVEVVAVAEGTTS